MVILHKSCRVSYKESNKIGFAIFWFIFDFLRNLQHQPETIYYLRIKLSNRPLEVFQILQKKPLAYRNVPRKKDDLAIGSSKVGRRWGSPDSGWEPTEGGLVVT
jgi:hypothetical protein